MGPVIFFARPMLLIFPSSLASSCYICKDKYSLPPIVCGATRRREFRQTRSYNCVMGKAVAEKNNTPHRHRWPSGYQLSVISSMTSTHVAVVITEPLISGLHDLERIIELANFFKCKTGVIVNKSDINRITANESRILYYKRHNFPWCNSL